MRAKALYQAGKLNEAIQSLGAELRENPTDAQRRTFLFELLCFAGEYERADKHLNVLASGSSEAQMGAVLYMSALHAERTRHKMFDEKSYPVSVIDEANQRGGTIDGKPFEWIEDSDPRVGARLETFAAGAYLWIPFEHIDSIEFQAPKRVRDLLWRPALVRTGPGFKQTELGEALVPVNFVHSWKHPDEAVKLGRSTVWENDAEGNPMPYGMKTFLIDDEDIPIMEITRIDFTPRPEEPEPEDAPAVQPPN